MVRVELKIEGMSCEHCVARTEKALASVPGVKSVEVRRDPDSATVSGESLELDALIEAVDRIGFTATPG